MVVVVVAVVVILVIVLGGSDDGTGGSGSSTGGGGGGTASTSDVQILSDNLACEEPPEIEILTQDFSCDKSEWSDYWDCEITGTVKNVGNSDATGFSVKATFFDSQGIKISDGSDYPGELEAGQTAYYDIGYFKTQQPQTYEIYIDSYSSDRCDCHLTGTVQNNGNKDASFVTVYAEFFDAQAIKIYDSLDIIGDLQAGQTASYDVWYWEDQCPADYEVWVEWSNW